MLCEKCKQNTATVHYQQSINGETAEYHLCEHCANEMQLTPSFDNMFKGFLSGFADPLPVSGAIHPSSASKCPTCGFTFNDIRSLGRFGCADCYKAFSPQIDSILKSIQSTTKHNGKFPRKSGSELRIKHETEELKLKLKKAVEEERYEEAARLRDKIKELEGGN